VALSPRFLLGIVGYFWKDFHIKPMQK